MPWLDFGEKSNQGLIYYANWGSSRRALTNGDWESVNAAQTLLVYYMIYKRLLYCNILQETCGMNVQIYRGMNFTPSAGLSAMPDKPHRNVPAHQPDSALRPEYFQFFSSGFAMYWHE